MKVLIVNSSDINGGAARAAYRLHQALLKSGVDSQMLVDAKLSDDYSVIGQGSKVIRGIRGMLDNLPIGAYKGRSPTYFSSNLVPFSGLVKRINALNPDIVHLHWVNKAMLSIYDISRIKAPVVWSLHDMWAFTGGCHYDENCAGYKQRCGNCKVLASIKENDLSRRTHNRKAKVFENIESLTVIALSQWMAKCAKESLLFSNKRVVCLPNPIDTTAFSPFDKLQARELLNLPLNKKLILFGAIEAFSDPRKGFKELNEALSLLEQEDVELVVFGSSQPEEAQGFRYKTHYLGHLHDEVSLRVLYSAADVMVIPSIQENLSNTIMESLACGTPVVGFDVGGNSDMIEHMHSGYLAKKYDTTELANGVQWVLNAPNYEELSKNSRNKVMREFDSTVVSKRYIELYASVLNKEN